MKIFKQNNIGFINEKIDSGVSWKNIISKYLSAKAFRENRNGYILVLLGLFFLGLLTIYSNYNAERLVNNVKRLEKMRKDKRAEYISSSSELMRMTQQSAVISLVEENNLKLEPLKFPPEKIEIEYDQD